MILRGGCHCGALAVELETALTVETLPLRDCQCTFCRRHAARNATDPAGHLRIVADADALGRYQFGLRTADFLVCRRCGVYVACVLDDTFGSLNTRVLDDFDRLAGPVTPVRYDDEDAATRLARRRQRWTATTIELRV